MTQRLTFHHGGKTQQLLGIMRHDARSLTLVILSPQGQRLLTLNVDDEQAYFLTDAAFEPPFSADWLASRLIWSLWPAPSLTEAFAGTPWRLEQQGITRDISYRDAPVVRIEQYPHCLFIDDRQGQYRLQIASLDKASPNKMEGSCPGP